VRKPHDLRHSFVSMLIQEGRSIAEVAQQAGHSVDKSTCRRLAHRSAVSRALAG
jgi:integrase